MIRLVIIALGFVLLLNAFDKIDAGIEAKRAGLLVNYHMPMEARP